MLQISNKTTARIVELVEGSVNKSHEFGPYTVEDLRQECLSYMWEKSLPRCDKSKPLDNYIRVCIKNWYMNFWRDKYARPGMTEDAFNKKRSLSEPVDIARLSDNIQPLRVDYDPVDSIDAKSVWDLIDGHLPPRLRHDYLRLKSGSKLPSYKRRVVMEEIRKIMVEQGLMAEDCEQIVNDD